MFNIMPKSIKIYNGPPDLTVGVMPAKNSINGIVPGGLGPQDTSAVSVTVHNRLLFWSGPFQADPNTIPAFGSDAMNVLLSITLSPGLRQVGGITVPVGFSAAVTPNNQIIILFGGTIPAGASLDFGFEVIGDSRGGMYETIWAEVDPSGSVIEAFDSNNKGSAIIFVQSLN